MNAIVEQMKNEIEALTSERDGLKAARYAYATEFPLNEEGQPDVGSIHQNIRALKADHAKVLKAAKLALDALDEAISYTLSPSWSPSMTDECKTASAALRQAGVQ